MRKPWVSILLGIALLFFPLRTAHAEEIRSFLQESTIEQSGIVAVTEKISYDFGQERKHGIYRVIPQTKTNSDGKQFVLSYDNITVTNERGVPYKFSRSSEDGEMSLKIGDPNKTISGLQTYVISYDVSGALTYFSDHDEFYWNVTGNDWHVPIQSYQSIVQIPLSTSTAALTARCFTGTKNSTDANCTSTIQGHTVEFTSTQALNPSEGVTIVVGFPKNIVAQLEPVPVSSFSDNPLFFLLFLINTVWYLIPLLLASVVWYLILPVIIAYRWLKHGRDPKPVIGEASVWFGAPKYPNKREITPAELALLLHEHVSTSAITATIVDLAHKGFLTMKQVSKKELLLTKTDAPTTHLLSHEKKLLNAIFAGVKEISTKDLSLYATYQSIQSTLAKESVKDGLFVKNPALQKSLYTIIAMIGLMSGNILLFIVCIVFGINMPKRTQIGSDMAAMGRSLKRFLASQEHQLTFQAKEMMLFEKLLPFAVALGVEKLWADRFKDVQIPPPTWYQGTDPFTTHLFVRSISSSFSKAEHGMTTTKSSSGFSSGFSGGSSGGGGGGGGGGSW